MLGQKAKRLLFKVADLPVMTRGRGVTLMRYREGGLVTAWTLPLEAGLTWLQGQRQRQEKDLRKWLGPRGGSGRAVPHGFPKDGKLD